MKAGWLLFFVLICFSQPALPIVQLQAQAKVVTPSKRAGNFTPQNLPEILRKHGFTQYNRPAYFTGKRIKIAILDVGFGDVKKHTRRRTYVYDPKKDIDSQGESHGFYMTMLVDSLLADVPAPIDLHLFNVAGYTNFSNAIRRAIRMEADVILHSRVWAFGSNFDGQGFINEAVNRATNSGIIWINSAGNYGRRTFNSDVRTGQDNWLELPGPNSSIVVRCNARKGKKCRFRATLSWNSFKNKVRTGTDKDLDLVLTDDTLNIITQSALVQTKQARPGGAFSLYPREIIQAELNNGLYFLRIKNRSKNFSSKDRLRVVTSGDSFVLETRSSDETVMPPADNPNVITVGALDAVDYRNSSRSRLLGKPELHASSYLKIDNERAYLGSSNAAAIAAAATAVLRAAEPGLSRAQVLQKLGGETLARFGRGLPLWQLQFDYLGYRCFEPVDPSLYPTPTYARDFTEAGGVMVHTSMGRKLFFDFDPASLLDTKRRQPDDAIFVTPNGISVVARAQAPQMVYGIELVQVPYGQRICRRNPQARRSYMELPQPVLQESPPRDRRGRLAPKRERERSREYEDDEFKADRDRHDQREIEREFPDLRRPPRR